MLEFVADTEYPVVIPCEDVRLNGLLYIPTAVTGVVIFVHGSGSGRFSPRNQYIAKELQRASFATLLFDLLTEKEDVIDTKTMEYRFDIELLAKRLIGTTQWLLENPVLHKLPLAYFGASTGGGAALLAAAKEKHHIKAIVSRGGRPDLAGDALKAVEAATLLIVGGDDEVVIELNEKAYERLHCVKQLEIVAGATHLFEETGKLEEVAHLAVAWFKRFL
jgi:putative phosphoribosyl transferase